MKRDDAEEACRLLLAAGVKRDEITPEAVMVADALIKQTARRLAARLIERLFPKWKAKEIDRSGSSQC